MSSTKKLTSSQNIKWTDKGREGDTELLIDNFYLPNYDSVKDVISKCRTTKVCKMIQQNSPCGYELPGLEQGGEECVHDAFKLLPRGGSKKLPSLKIKTSWDWKLHSLNNFAVDRKYQIFLGGDNIFSTEFSIGRPVSNSELVITTKLVDKKMLLAYSPPIYLPLKYFGFIENFVSDMGVSNLFIDHQTTINKDFLLKEYRITTNAEVKINQEGNTLTVYKRNGKMTWSPEKSDIDIKIQSDMMSNELQISGRRDGSVGLLFYPFYILAGGELFGRTQSSNFFFNRQSAMTSKYSINYGSNEFAMESDVNIKNVKEFDYKWKVTTPANYKPWFFKEIGVSGTSVQSSDGTKRNMDHVYEMKGRAIFLSGPYNPSMVDKITEKVTYIKHTERLQSGTRRYDNYLIQYTTTIPRFETITLSRKADLDGDEFKAANRVSPVTTKVEWPGQEIKLVENFAMTEDDVKLNFVLTTTYESFKKLEYTFDGSGENCINHSADLKFEGMGGYVYWNRAGELKQGNQYDASFNVKSSWIPKTEVIILLSKFHKNI